MENDMKLKAEKYFTFKIYLHNKRLPIVLEGLTKQDVDEFNQLATSKMFIKYGPIIIRSDAIDYIIVK